MPGPAPVLLKTIIVLPRKSSNPFEKCKKKIHKGNFIEQRKIASMHKMFVLLK
jgi:hypothetical protein